MLYSCPRMAIVGIKGLTFIFVSVGTVRDEKAEVLHRSKYWLRKSSLKWPKNVNCILGTGHCKKWLYFRQNHKSLHVSFILTAVVHTLYDNQRPEIER